MRTFGARQVARGGTLIALLGSAAVIVGCNGGGSVPLSELGARTAETYCGLLDQCYGPDLLEAFTGGNCVATFQRTFDEQTLPQFEQAIAEGTLRYDGARAAGCLDQLEAAGCGFIDRPELSECEAALEGTIALGGACSINEECTGTAFCAMDTMCPGTCQARVAPGTACEDDGACGSGLRCFDGTCRSPALADAPCGGGTNPDCAGGLICRGEMEAPPGGTGTSGTCVSPASIMTAPLGEACNPSEGPFCQSGLSCALTGVTGGTTPNFVCVAASTSGGTCNVSFPDMCPAGQICDAMPFVEGGSFDGTCQPLPTDGEACVQSRCAAGHRCDGATCQAIGSVGAACESGADCYSASCDAGVCALAELCE